MILIYGDDQQWDAMSPTERHARDAAQVAFGAAAGQAVLGGEELETASVATSARMAQAGRSPPPTARSWRPKRCSAVSTCSKPPPSTRWSPSLGCSPLLSEPALAAYGYLSAARADFLRRRSDEVRQGALGSDPHRM